MTVLEATIREQECSEPGTRTVPDPSSPECTRSSASFSSPIPVGRSICSGSNEISYPQSST